MLVARAPLKFAILPVGLGLGAAAWFAFGGANPPSEIAQLGARLTAVQPLLRTPVPATPAPLGALTQTRPLFDLGSPGAAGEPTLVLQGLALGAGGKAALIAIGASSPVWLTVGESRLGVTLRRVDASSALVETVSGDHSLTLGAGHAAAASPVLPTTAAGNAVGRLTPPDAR